MMKSIRFCLVLCLPAILFILSGCDGIPKPANFPKVFPHVIIINKDGSPLDEVTIQLIPESASAPWGVGGKTDSAGRSAVATFQGSYSRVGCPEGKYQVVLSRMLMTGLELSEAEFLKLSGSEAEAYSVKIEAARKKQPKVIPPSCTSAKTTPLTIEVSKSSKETVIELSQYKK